MKTIQKLCKKFHKVNPTVTAELDEYNSALGYYRIVFTDLVTKVSGCIYFATCREFDEWIRGVVIE